VASARVNWPGAEEQMESVLGALSELDHAFGGVAYKSRRALPATASRPAVLYEGEPQSKPESVAKAPWTQREKKRTQRALPRYIDLDSAGTLMDVAALSAVRKKARGTQLPAPGGGDDNETRAELESAAADSSDAADFEALLQQHMDSRGGQEQRVMGTAMASLAPNLTPSGEPIDAATRNVARLISDRLEECVEGARLTVERIIALLGAEKAIELLERAEATETAGGLITMDGTRRRRTRGGIFFYLVKQITNKAEKAYVWQDAAAEVATQRHGAPSGRGRGRGRGGAMGRGAAGAVVSDRPSGERVGVVHARSAAGGGTQPETMVAQPQAVQAAQADAGNPSFDDEDPPDEM
jgi:hypothetical protein